MDDEFILNYDGGAVGLDVSSSIAPDASAFITTQLEGLNSSAQQVANQGTSWIQDALGYVSTGVSYASGIVSRLGLNVGGISTPRVAPAPVTAPGQVAQPQGVQVGQGGTGGTSWILYALAAAVVLLVLWVLFGG